jgi:hypothetical protein
MKGRWHTGCRRKYLCVCERARKIGEKGECQTLPQAILRERERGGARTLNPNPSYIQRKGRDRAPNPNPKDALFLVNAKERL